MIKELVPHSKLGTPYQSPSWRYQAIFYPEKFGLGWLCSKRDTVNAGHLSRMFDKGLRPSSIYNIPIYFKELLNELPPHHVEQLLKVWNKHYARQHKRKSTFNSATSSSVLLSWNMQKVEESLNDAYLKQMVQHFYGYKHNKVIATAAKFYRDSENSMNRSWINYSFYAGLSDNEIAKAWGKTITFVRAMRMMFFDYSHWPKDRIAQFSMIRQMVSNQELSEPDYHCFRRIYDLGLAGLKSILGVHTLTPDDAKRVEQYLGLSTIDNLLNIRYTVTTNKEAHQFNSSVAVHMDRKLKKLEIEQRNELLRLTCLREAKELGVNEETQNQVEELELIASLKSETLRNPHPVFPSFIAMKQLENKITVENQP